jgi:hypothetical protein
LRREEEDAEEGKSTAPPATGSWTAPPAAGFLNRSAATFMEIGKLVPPPAMEESGVEGVVFGSGGEGRRLR